ncbi:MAG TPA: carboxypeptidase regulatory-like domain-containing protein [Pyrinomonadaceae bacterium]|nr:carboxypeptidase regulatory-like domain-containing protein [Pyrinomonadaceae bacterium]
MRKLSYTLALLCCFTVTAFAQTQFATITGRVADPNDAAIPGARVVLTNVATNSKIETTTNDDGLYVIGNVPAAAYELSVEKEGFKTSKLNITAAVAQRLTSDVHLEVGGIGEVVTITDDAVINTSSGELGRTVTEKEIVNLPLLTRNPYALVALAPGAQDTGAVNGDIRGLGISVNGQRTSSINFMLDGGENNDTFVAGVGQVVPLDAVQEFRVQTNNMTAEFGRNSIVTNVITKSGANEYHGSFYEFYRGSGLSTSTFEDNARGTPKSNFVRNQFGGSFGGPIIRDKTFYFGSYEGLRVRSSSSNFFIVPTQAFLDNASAATNAFTTAFGGLPAANDPSGNLTAQQIIEDIEGCGPYGGDCVLRNSTTGAVIPAETVLFSGINVRGPTDSGGGIPQNTHLFTARIDHRFSSDTSLLGRFAFQNTNFFDGSISLSPYEGFNTGQRSRNQNLNLTLTHNFSPTLFNESRVIFNRIFANQPLGEAPGTTPCWQYALSFNTPSGDGITFPGYVPNVCAFAGIPFGGPQNIYQGFTGFTKSAGKHTLKFGGQVLHMRDNRTFGAYQNAFIDTETMQGMLDGLTDVIIVAIDPRGKVPGDIYDTNVDGPFIPPSFTRHFRYNEWALYAEDTFKVSNRLTLNLGLRWEYFGVLHSPENEKFLDANLYLSAVGTADPNRSIFEQVRDARFRRTSQFYRQDWNDFAPRVGFAWDVFGSGKTVLRGGYGIFYDRNFGNAVFNAIQNPPNYATVTLFPLGNFGGDPALIDPNQFNTLGQLSGGGLTIASSARMLDNDLRTAYSAQWNLTGEQEWKGLVTSLSYVGSNGYKLYSLNNLNQIGSCELAPGLNPTCGTAGRTSRLNQTGLTGMNRRGNEGLSRYHGMSADIRMDRLSTTGLSLRGSYTWSHSIDNSSSFFGDSPFEGNFGFGFRDPYNPALDRASSANDVRHRMSISGTWEIPFFRGSNGFAGQVLRGWTISSIFQAQTGAAFTVYDGVSVSCNTSGTNFCHPVITGSGIPALQTNVESGANRFNLYTGLTNIFTTQDDFCGGDIRCANQLFNLHPELLSPRNLFRTPGYWNLDMAVFKNFRMPWEGHQLQFRAEFFNLPNHSNLFVVPATNVFTGSDADAVTGARGVRPDGILERRNIQLAIRYTF